MNGGGCALSFKVSLIVPIQRQARLARFHFDAAELQSKLLIIELLLSFADWRLRPSAR